MTEDKKHVTETPVVEVNKTGDLYLAVEKNNQLAQLIYEQNKKIKHRLDLMVWGGVLKWIFILAPIILALIYLPTLLKPLLEQYSGLLGGTSGAEVQSSQLDTLLKGVSPSQIQDVMKILGK
jgi:hypothetical protein